MAYIHILVHHLDWTSFFYRGSPKIHNGTRDEPTLNFRKSAFLFLLVPRREKIRKTRRLRGAENTEHLETKREKKKEKGAAQKIGFAEKEKFG